MKYIIFGLPGVGKTSVVNGVLERTKIKHIHWGNLSFEVAKRMGLVKDVDELRQLDLDKQKEVRKEVTAEIDKISKEYDDILVETHAAVKTPQGYWPGLSKSTLDRIDFDVFIVLTADPGVIFERRLKDESRWRKDEVTIDSIREAISISKQMAITYSVLCSGTFIEVENRQNDMNHAVDAISELIERGRVSSLDRDIL